MTKVKCTRCDGTGKYSFNLKDGNMCYGCEGKGYTLKTTAQIKRAAAPKKVSKSEEWRVNYYLPTSQELQAEAAAMFPELPYQLQIAKFEQINKTTFGNIVTKRLAEKGLPTRY